MSSHPPAAGSLVLVFNAGSSSLKFALLRPGSGERLMGGIGERLGTPEALLRVQWFPAAATEERVPAGGRFLAKPFTLVALLEKVRAALE